MDCSQRDRFELISAFLDGETSPADSQRVRELLAEDPQARQLYQRLLHLQQKLRDLPEPEPSISANELTERVFTTLDRRQQRQLEKLRQGLRSLPKPEPSISAGVLAEEVFATVDERRRYRRALWWSGGAIAASFLALLSVSGILSPPGNQPSAALMVSLHEPLLDLSTESSELEASTQAEPDLRP
ncbi:MAG: hypothetical protein AAFY11_13810 [Cyanobacteria bacterium J06641_5]